MAILGWMCLSQQQGVMHTLPARQRLSRVMANRQPSKQLKASSNSCQAEQKEDKLAVWLHEEAPHCAKLACFAGQVVLVHVKKVCMNGRKLQGLTLTWAAGCRQDSCFALHRNIGFHSKSMHSSEDFGRCWSSPFAPELHQEENNGHCLQDGEKMVKVYERPQMLQQYHIPQHACEMWQHGHVRYQGNLMAEGMAFRPNFLYCSRELAQFSLA